MIDETNRFYGPIRRDEEGAIARIAEEKARVRQKGRSPDQNRHAVRRPPSLMNGWRGSNRYAQKDFYVTNSVTLENFVGE